MNEHCITFPTDGCPNQRFEAAYPNGWVDYNMGGIENLYYHGADPTEFVAQS